MNIKMLAGLVAVPAALALAMLLPQAHADAAAQAMPAPALDMPAPSAPGLQTAVFAGGCFWGVQGVFEHVKGVTEAVSGYTGGGLANPNYRQVSAGNSGHAESVRVTFDPAQISYGQLLQIFFSVALDPTQVDRQGPDWGTQYRSELFVDGPAQERVAQAYVAEAYHQDYLTLHPDSPYIAVNDLPKVRAVQTLFPDAWRDKPTLVTKASSES